MGDLDFHLLEQKFNIRTTQLDDAVITIAAKDLLLPNQATTFLNEYATILRATDTTAAAAYFAGNFCGVALAMLYSVSTWNSTLNMSLSNETIQIYPEQSRYRYAFVLKDWTVLEGPVEEPERSLWRLQAWTRFYGETVRPLFERLSADSGLHISQLWGQFPTRFNYFMATQQQETCSTRLKSDYEAMLQELEGSVFGCSHNPLQVKIRYLEDARNPNEQVRMKNVCCLYYKTGEEQYCYTCPKLKPEERERIKAKLQAASVH